MVKTEVNSLLDVFRICWERRIFSTNIHLKNQTCDLHKTVKEARQQPFCKTDVFVVALSQAV